MGDRSACVFNGRLLWHCDVAYKNGKYHAYFPLKDRADIFRIGVAIADRPKGTFIPAGGAALSGIGLGDSLVDCLILGEAVFVSS
jgi:hypothetical protein